MTNYFTVTLHNGQDVIFEFDEFDRHKAQFVRTVIDTPEEDFKTAFALNIQNIPKGMTVRVVSVYQNYYGFFLNVLYDGRVYSINPRNVEYVMAGDKT